MVKRLLITLISISAFIDVAAYDFMAGGLCYNKNTDGTTVTVTYQNTSSPRYTNLSGAVSIPSKVTSGGVTYNVTAIGASAFDGCSGMTSVSIPTTVTTIGNYAFNKCTGLTSVTIPVSVTAMGYNTFRYCESLKTVKWNAKSCADFVLGGEPFSNCPALITFEFGSQVTRVPAYICRTVNALKSITISNTVTTIGERAFDGCCSMTSLSLGSSLQSIGGYAFCDCSALTNLVIPNSVTTIAASAFLSCTGLTSVTIGTGLTSMGQAAFGQSTNLKTVKWNAKNYPDISSGGSSPLDGIHSNVTVEFGSEVERIPSYLCYSMDGMTSVTIPSSVKSAGNMAFYGCEALTSVKITDLAAWCKISFETGTGNPLYYAHNLYLNGAKVTNLTIPSTITEIGKFTFKGGSCLVSVTIPTSVKSIGDCAFEGCSGLKSLTIPNSVTSIGIYAFEDCIGLTSLSIGTGLTTIERSVFRGCSGLKSVNIPNTVTKIDDGAFSGCSGLTSVTIGTGVATTGTTPFYNCTGLTTVKWNAKNCADPSDLNFYPFRNLTNITTMEFGDQVEHIPARIADGLTGLTSVTIGTSVTSVGNYAFNGCTGLKNVKWNAKNYSTETYCLAQKSSITSFEFGNQVAVIPPELCYQLLGLTSITIPSSVKSIGAGAFNRCEGLTSMHISDLEAWCNVSIESGGNPLYYAQNLYLNGAKVTDLVIPSSVTEIGSNAFYGASCLTSVTIPNTVTSIGKQAFRLCTGLQSVLIPNSVTTIDQNAFYECTGLTSLNIGSSVATIASRAFEGCSALQAVTIPESVSSVGIRAFERCTSLTSVKWNAKSCPDYASYLNTPFEKCTGLASFEFGHQVERIPQNLCYGLTGLRLVVIGKAVSEIGNQAFKGCTALERISSYPDPADIVLKGAGTFTDVPKETCELHVLPAHIDAYTEADQWKDFMIIVGDLNDIEGDLNGDGSIDSSDVSILLEKVLLGGAYIAAADLNGDGTIDSSDVSALLERVLAGS